MKVKDVVQEHEYNDWFVFNDAKPKEGSMSQIIDSSVLNKQSIAIAVVNEVLGDSLKGLKPDEIKMHPIYSVIHKAKSMDLTMLRQTLKQEFEKIDWQLVTTNYEYQIHDSIYPSFGIAPIVKKPVRIVYHATKTTTIQKILKEGLLPSNFERSATNFPDTEGVIHACEKLISCENNSAEWWMKHLSKNNRFDDPHWGIVRIDLSSLKNVRVHQDMHSESGLVIDKIDRIPAELITEMLDYKTEDKHANL
ncbi:MAG: hypothetical protein QM703_24625 [Gemmatales bacterium]